MASSIRGCCIVLFLQLANVFLIGACSNLLVAAKRTDITDHGDKWVEKLITWSIVGICVGALHVVFIFGFCCCADIPEESVRLRNERIAICLIELVAMALVITAIIVPGIDQWPESYQETDLAMYAGLCFVVFNCFMAYSAGRAACSYKAPVVTTNERNEHNVEIAVVEIQTTNWVIGRF